MLNQHLVKKALFMSAFFMLFTSCTDTSADYNCKPPEKTLTETAKVKWVYDGDTLLLTDKRKVRIIGIDTPETSHHQQRAEAYGAKAREALRELLKKSNYEVTLHYGQDKQDKYSRTLAHVFLPDGTNISSWLLGRGFARTLAIPPNIKLAECYKQAESLAQQESLNIWSQSNNQLITASILPYKIKGFVRLKGKIHSVKNYRKSTTIELESHNKRPIQLKIKKKNRHYFKSFNPEKLNGRNIIVSGMLKNKYGKRIIYLNHSSQIEILAPKEKAPTKKWSSNNED